MPGVDPRDGRPGHELRDDTAREDLGLARAAAAGDAAAFERIVRSHAGLVLGLGMRMLKNRADAEDLVQDVFLRVHRSLPSFRGESSLRTWIGHVTVNAARNRHRGDSRRLRHLAPVPDAAGDDPPELEERAADTGAGPERLALSSEARGRIEAALALLPEEFREAVVLRDVEGLAYDEIAGVLGVSEGTVKSRIARGRARLQEALADLVSSRLRPR